MMTLICWLYERSTTVFTETATQPPGHSTRRNSKRPRTGLDRLVIGIRQLPDTRLANPPRMADFATWAVASGLYDFETAYRANRQAAIDVILDHDALARAVRAFVQQEWAGTATELLDVLGPSVKITSAKTLSDELARLAPMLRTVGLDIKYQRKADRRGIRIIRL